MAKVNDIVRFLNATGGGRISRIEGRLAYVEDSDGFEQPVLLRECVVVDEHKPAGGDKPSPSVTFGRAPRTTSDTVEQSAAIPSGPTQPVAQVEPALPVVETAEGEKLNVVLAYEPKDIKRLESTNYYVYLVNDSNYYLYIAYMSSDGSQNGLWHTRFHGLIEPNVQVLLEEITHDDLPQMGRVAVQLIPFKQDKAFNLKNPVLVEQRLDTTKFYKLHCFRQSEYFDTSVITLDIVKDDRPARNLSIDSKQLEQAMLQKERVDARGQAKGKRPASKKSDAGKGEIIECDLHISALLDTTAGMSNGDMLNYQLAKFREVMDANIRRQGAKIVFVHGKGEGVLRKALLDELHRRYPRCEAQDASFREYGFGATLVKIHS